MSTKRTVGMYATFDRSGRATRSSHYCAGCGHGILHKLIAEALVELGLQDRTVIINPIGCAVFGYYYWDVGNIGAAHGRAPAVATAISRTIPQAVVLSYQGDGDLAAIGFNCAVQAASRGEHMATFMVNNCTYGMTGGQMSPTSLIGQRTLTSPLGRSAATEGYPLQVAEMVNQLRAPIYIARCSVADTKRILQTKKIVRKAIELQRDGKGYVYVEVLSPCPTAMGLDPLASARFVTEQMEKDFPLGILRDTSEQALSPAPPAPAIAVHDLFAQYCDREFPPPRPDPSYTERRMIFAGSGGQGILALGLCIVEAGAQAQRFVTWYPTYGPEQRGGPSSCAMVVGGQLVGTPAVDHPDILVCMTRPMMERFLATVKPGGVVFYDPMMMEGASSLTREDVRRIAVPATEIATANGSSRAANTVMLTALLHTGVTGLPEETILRARDAALRKKPTLIGLNRRVFEAGLAWCRKNLK
ncbi:MAG: 2-oxoacid:acceptor oxidoreductase family protein [Kiritimatiellia bacterium]